MKIPEHFYSKLGLALILLENKMSFSDLRNTPIKKEHLELSIRTALDEFRLEPSESIEKKEKVKIIRVGKQKGNPKKYLYLSPWIITNDLSSSSSWKDCLGLIDLWDKKEWKGNDFKLKMSYSPLSAEYNNGKGRRAAKVEKLEHYFNAIATISPNKPALTVVSYSGNKPSYKNTAIIPDLPLKELIFFLELFNKIKKRDTENLFVGRIKQEEKGKGKNKKTVYSLTRERINVYKGNFPNAPYHNSLNALALLGALGYWAKRAETRDKTLQVLDELKKCPIYLVRYGNAEVTSYHSYAVELAKSNSLSKVINSCYKIDIYSQPLNKKWDRKNAEYNKLYLFFSRFLQLFSISAFKDLMAIRAEYPTQIAPLFIIYFLKTINMDKEIISAAKSYGQQLNLVAFIAAQASHAEAQKKGNNRMTLWERKARALVELESAIYSARSIDALFSQISTRAARLIKGGFEISSECEPFISAALTMQLNNNEDKNLEIAKHLAIIFLRLRFKKQGEEKKSNHQNTIDYQEAFEALGIQDDEDYSE